MSSLKPDGHEHHAMGDAHMREHAPHSLTHAVTGAVCGMVSSLTKSQRRRSMVRVPPFGAAQLIEAARAIVALGGSPRSRGATELVGSLPWMSGWP